MKPQRIGIHRTLDVWIQEGKPFWQGDPIDTPYHDVVSWVHKHRRILHYVEQWMELQKKEERGMKGDPSRKV